MTENYTTTDDDEKLPHLENFLRPFEKLSREELDRMFKRAKECIANEAEAIAELKRQAAEVGGISDSRLPFS